MAAQVVSLLVRRESRSADWTREELAELYRIEHALVQSGLSVDIGRGLTDEGDPWFVFCRPDGEVLIHLTRYDGSYRLYSPALPSPLMGRSFSELTKAFARQVPMQVTLQRNSNEPRLFVHPAAMLAVVIGTIFIASNELVLFPQAGEADKKHGDASDATPAHGLKALLQTTFQLYMENFLTWLRDGSAIQQSAYFGILSTIAAFLVGSDTATSDHAGERAGQPHSATADATHSHDADLASVATGAPSQAEAGHRPADNTATAIPTQDLQNEPHNAATAIHIASVETGPNPASAPAAGQQSPDATGTAQTSDNAQIGAHAFSSTDSEASVAPVPGQPGILTVAFGASHSETPAVFSSAPLATPSQATVVSDLISALSAAVPAGQGAASGSINGQTGPTNVDLAAAAADLGNLFSHATEVNLAGSADLVTYVLADSTATAPSAVQAAQSGPPMFNAAAAAILLNFLQENPNAQAVFSNNSVVVYDSLHDSTPATVEVWKFTDGSTIAIVGHADHGFVAA